MLIVFVSASSSCTNLKPEEPDAEPFLEAPSPRSSMVNIPITFEVSQLEEKINKQITGEFYQDTTFSDHNNDNLKIKLSRFDRVKIKMSGNKMVTTFPLDVSSEVLFEKKILGINIRKKQKLDFKVNVEFESIYSVNRDWEVITSTSLKELNWIDEPKVKVAIFNVKVSKLVEKIVKRNEDRILRKIDHEIKANIHLQKTISKVWNDIQKPILVNRQLQKVWIKLDPTSVSVNPLTSNGKRIIINTYIDAQLRSNIGDSIEAFTVKALPQLKITKRPVEEFDLNLQSKISFDEINDVLEDVIKGQEIKVSGHNIIVKDASFSGNGQNLILKLNVKGDAKGTLYFKGKPYFDPEKEVLIINDFNYDIYTEEVIVKVADWLYHNDFKDKLQGYLVLPLGNQLKDIPLLIENAVDKGKLGKKINLNISSMKVSPQDIVIRPEGIHTTINAKGKVEIMIEKI
jgi:hypothetical protein